MATKNKNRVRNRIINFRVTPSEYEEIQARIKVCGMPKGEYFIQSLLHQNICISVGKYQSDRLSLEFKKLREVLETVSDIDEMVDIANECKALLNQLIIITKDNQKLSQDDFITKKKPKQNLRKLKKN